MTGEGRGDGGWEGGGGGLAGKGGRVWREVGRGSVEMRMRREPECPM